jgi:hypothetical protein
LRSLTISRSRLIRFEVSSSGGNTKGRIAYLSGAQAEGRCWREADIRETPTSVKCQNATSPEQRTSAAKDEGATRG